MFNKYDKDFPAFAGYINKMINEDKLSHAFLIECKNIGNYKQILLEFIKKILDKNKYQQNLDIATLVDNNNYPELKIIEPINNIIRKEQLLELQKEFSVQSIYGKYMIYIIDGAEYLNHSSANTMLKFLEEPPTNVIAILLTSNLYNVIDTISSRCQKFILNNHKREEKFSEKIEEVVRIIETKKKDALGFLDSSWYLLNREQLIERFIELKNYYMVQMEKESKKDILMDLSKKIIIIDDCLKKIRYNVNIKLLIDKFILSITEVI